MLRTAASGMLALIALYFAVASLNPASRVLGFSYRDSPTGLYLTMMALGFTLAALFALSAGAVASRRLRGFATWTLLGGLALAASALPYITLLWTSKTAWSGWSYVVRPEPGWIAWLLLPTLPAAIGVAIQLALVLFAFVFLLVGFRHQEGAPVRQRSA